MVESEWGDKALTLYFDERKLLRAMKNLYTAGGPFDADVTYSTGSMWEGLQQPLQKFDLHPQVEGVIEADARCLPLAAESVSSIMFDPPFVMKNTTERTPNGIIETRFAGYATPELLWGMYRGALAEFWRVLRPTGIVAFKCQDVVSSGRQQWSHIRVFEYALAQGFVVQDLFVLGRKSVLWSPNMRRQKHARKNHCFYWVFLKPQGKTKK